MKILVISNLYPPDALGGYEMGCRQVVENLRARGHEVRVLTTAPRTPVASPPHVRRTLRLTDMWVDYHMSRCATVTQLLDESESHRINAFNVHALLGELDDFEPDVAYVWMLTGIGGLGLMATLHHLRVPWVWHLMDDVPATLCQLDNQVIPALAREIERQLRGHTIACSQQLVDEIERRGVRLQGEVEIVPNWVAGPVPPLRSEFYQGDRPLRIVASAAHIDRCYDKGMDLLIKAAATLRDQGRDNFSLDIFGQVNDSFYGDLIKSNHLSGLVTLRGSLKQADLIAAYQDYDVFAFPARLREPCAFAPLEAAPSGCVTVMSILSGNSEWLVHGVHCLKVPRTSEGFAHMFGEILDGRVDLEPIGRRGALAVRRDFHLDKLLPKIERILTRAARQSRDGAGTSDEVYRLALLAEKLTSVLIQEPYCA
ncbi:glycosyltransferase family 4 protein [Singulisphaera acidiphila]|uniref:Glycosyltransferase n=1 Tax=Singulisphaera acidiphila (strain ATCC BAA-1392 / DSM 18658 / VKM B-2454 / MOB10) TaxID=886293 RepID=L0D931_SINAD|nr:glycosyltransferase family 4 protein [Singulisphaera acidiphila]AGA25884.1 glycosyltransferase [Singulisphaera acidiphila DSM 18658]